jgi:RNA exonuclease 4
MNSGDDMGGDDKPQTNRKRIRIRRRRRGGNRDFGADGASEPNATAHQPQRPTTKLHDAPMTKRDLYFCLRCGFIKVAVSAVSATIAAEVEKQGLGAETTPAKEQSIVARVCLVNWSNMVVLDAYVAPQPLSLKQSNTRENFDSSGAGSFVITHELDYRTEQTGITAKHLEDTGHTMTMIAVRQNVKRQIKGKILIGHTLPEQLDALGLTHPWCDTRDTAHYAPYMKEVSIPLSQPMLLQSPTVAPLEPVELQYLLKRELGWNVVTGGLIGEAIGCLDLYKRVREDWESELSILLREKAIDRQCMAPLNRPLVISPRRHLKGRVCLSYPASSESVESHYSCGTENTGVASIPQFDSSCVKEDAASYRPAFGLRQFDSPGRLEPNWHSSPPDELAGRLLQGEEAHRIDPSQPNEETEISAIARMTISTEASPGSVGVAWASLKSEPEFNKLAQSPHSLSKQTKTTDPWQEWNSHSQHNSIDANGFADFAVEAKPYREAIDGDGWASDDDNFDGHLPSHLIEDLQDDIAGSTTKTFGSGEVGDENRQ